MLSNLWMSTLNDRISTRQYTRDSVRYSGTETTPTKRRAVAGEFLNDFFTGTISAIIPH